MDPLKSTLLELLELYSRKYPVLPYDPDHSPEWNAVTGGRADMLRILIKEIAMSESIDDLLTDLHSRFPARKEA